MQTTIVLYAQLQALQSAIAKQIQQVNATAVALDCTPQELKNAHGDFMLTPLLLAQAQVLGGMAQLKAAKG